jgi:hypothetical protein
MYKNKIIDKALEEEEKRQEELKKELVKKTYEFMNRVFGSDYQESFKEVRFKDYDFPFFEPIGYEGIVFDIALDSEESVNTYYNIFKVSENKIHRLDGYSMICFINIYNFSVDIKYAFDLIERRKKRGIVIEADSQEIGWKSWIPKGLREKL